MLLHYDSFCITLTSIHSDDDDDEPNIKWVVRFQYSVEWIFFSPHQTTWKPRLIQSNGNWRFYCYYPYKFVVC